MTITTTLFSALTNKAARPWALGVTLGVVLTSLCLSGCNNTNSSSSGLGLPQLATPKLQGEALQASFFSADKTWISLKANKLAVLLSPKTLQQFNPFHLAPPVTIKPVSQPGVSPFVSSASSLTGNSSTEALGQPQLIGVFYNTNNPKASTALISMGSGSQTQYMNRGDTLSLEGKLYRINSMSKNQVILQPAKGRASRKTQRTLEMPSIVGYQPSAQGNSSPTGASPEAVANPASAVNGLQALLNSLQQAAANGNSPNSQPPQGQ